MAAGGDTITSTVSTKPGTVATDPAAGRFWAAAPGLLARLDAATSVLAASRAVDEDVTQAVEHLVTVVGRMTPDQFAGGDPYLVEALLVGTVGCAAALWSGPGEAGRRELRVPLERTRQALRDLIAEHPVSADVPAKEIARWVVGVAGVPQQDVAEVIGVAPRTVQRWVSATDTTRPSGAEEVRLRTVARAVDQLRWSMTPAGVVLWLRRPHPALGDRRPCDVLDEPGAYAELYRLAAASRGLVAG